ncbi:Coenzyme F420 hydrogenase/dehydrogenase, beta subunit C-terminal domain [Vagococcus sp.]|uniref:Coenzyme F420 hydrogenase/dehydrogenase, beta subunit C-terminal domain n=1 Tax=Vagococcus sp. TaxID=1933889 RepID=UPI003F9711C6
MKEFEINKVFSSDYDFGTGVAPFLNEKLYMNLNRYGEYKTCFLKDKEYFSEDELTLLKKTNCLISDMNENEVSDNLFKEIEGIKFDTRIGYYKGLYAGYVSEGNFRENGSSGGLGTWIFTELLRLGYIDSIIHVKQSNNSNILFEYTISKNKKDIINGAKTKYYPVELSEVLKLVKEVPGKYAVIGVPSFIMELRLLSKVDVVINERIKYMIGLICGHQKSSKYSDFLAWQCGIKPGELSNIDYRKKNENDPANSYSIEVSGKVNGESKKIVKKMSELYGGDWGKGFFKVRASDFSDDVMNETADITLGDAWLPKYTLDSEGNNIVIVRNEVLYKIIKIAISEGRLKLDEVSVDTIAQSQSSHYQHSQDELAYRLYKKKKKEQWFPKKRISPSNKISYTRRKIQDVREKYCFKTRKSFIEAVNKNNYKIFLKRLYIIDLEYRFIYKIIWLKNKIKRKFVAANLVE